MYEKILPVKKKYVILQLVAIFIISPKSPLKVISKIDGIS